jgi:hypothetical protein
MMLQDLITGPKASTDNGWAPNLNFAAFGPEIRILAKVSRGRAKGEER